MNAKKEEADLLAQTDPKAKSSKIILPQFKEAVKAHDLKTVLSLADMSPKDAVELLGSKFPSFDKTVLSKCCNPSKYGCVLHPDGYTALRERIGEDEVPELPQETAPEPHKRRKSSDHKFTCRVAGRLPDEKYMRLQRYIRMEGYETTQNWVTAQVDSFIREMELKYGNQGTP